MPHPHPKIRFWLTFVKSTSASKFQIMSQIKSISTSEPRFNQHPCSYRGSCHIHIHIQISSIFIKSCSLYLTQAISASIWTQNVNKLEGLKVSDRSSGLMNWPLVQAQSIFHFRNRSKTLTRKICLTWAAKIVPWNYIVWDNSSINYATNYAIMDFQLKLKLIRCNDTLSLASRYH